MESNEEKVLLIKGINTSKIMEEEGLLFVDRWMSFENISDMGQGQTAICL